MTDKPTPTDAELEALPTAKRITASPGHISSRERAPTLRCPLNLE